MSRSCCNQLPLISKGFLPLTASPCDMRATYRDKDSCNQSRQFPLTQYTLCVYDTRMRSADVIAHLEADGWREVARKGSHAQFKHPQKPGRVTVPHPKRDIPAGTLRSIERQSGLKLR
ncbi:type II toxin-antitoxin system HicA family toxin [Mesorhizobium sp. AaZ16]|uniref:type II toxin-antitoxin system HicA family toxin n=1 Tax=Mesorhizobium sp. AaZ16 TaxID=3402289 RepID=UPI00374F29CB